MNALHVNWTTRRLLIKSVFSALHRKIKKTNRKILTFLVFGLVSGFFLGCESFFQCCFRCRIGTSLVLCRKLGKIQVKYILGLLAIGNITNTYRCTSAVSIRRYKLRNCDANLLRLFCIFHVFQLESPLTPHKYYVGDNEI